MCVPRNKKIMKLLSQRLYMAKDIGVHGNLFGGILLAWLDESAVTFACDVCQTGNMVTLKLDELIFKEPVKVGYQIMIYGKLVSVGNTSVQLYIEARRKNVHTREERVVCSTKFVFVRIDNNGEAIPLDSSIKSKLKKEV